MAKPYLLYAAKGGGSMIVEAAFGFTKLPLQIQDLDWKDLGWSSKSLRDLNPLGQVPTLISPDGTTLTESAAIILHLADRVNDYALVPSPKHKQRAQFLRWLVFLVSAVYPTFTYGDVTERWVKVKKDQGAGMELRGSTDAHRQDLLRYLEGQAKAPYFLGRQMTALDLYIWVLATWRPGPAWLNEHCPKLSAIAKKLEKHPVCLHVSNRNKL